MRKTTLILLTLILSIPAFAADKHQSYFAYDDGGTIVKQGDDGREIDARVNMPVYPGDEVITNRRGRAEIRLSDGNVLGIDRATAVYFRAILDSYEGEADQTIAELRYGKIAIHRTELGREAVRLDTSNASYVASHETVYSVETDSRGKDRVLVLDGSIEVRTRNRATRLRSGEGAEVDDRGVYDLISDSRTGTDDFERWFLKRAERRDGGNHRYLDRRLGYWADDLDDNGRWVQVTGIGWSWRPHVGAGWRPYYHGEWISSRTGCLTWVSYDPFGWVPYHYGRWAHDPFHGWVWVPGYGYSPAWVYWWYSPGFVGWAPAGLWDCHRGYYDWAYRPYSRAGLDFGFGFYGRVRINEVDLRPWTFLDSNNIVSHRVDRAAITADVVKQRLGRSGGGGFATVSSDPARFTREEFRDPAAAINRRAVRGGQGTEVSGAADVTPFIRRDPDLGGTVRDRVVRGRTGTPAGGAAPSTPTATAPSRGGLAPIGGGTSVAPIGRGSVAPIGGGNVSPIGGGSVAPVGGGTSTPAEAPRVNRGGSGSRGESGRINRGEPVNRDQPVNREPTAPAVVTPAEPPARSSESWRGRVKSEPSEPEARRSEPSSGADKSWRNDSGESTGSDVPRRVIERSSGTRVTPREVETDKDRSSSSGRSSASSPRSSSGSGSGSSTRSSGGSSSGRSSGSSGGSSSGSSTRSGSSNSGSSNSGNRSEGGKIKKD